MKIMLSAAASGRDLDAAKSEALQKLAKLPRLRTIAVLDDDAADSRHLVAVLNILLGRDIQILEFRSTRAAIRALRAEPPDLLFLDDFMRPLDRAETSLKALRTAGMRVPVVIVSGLLTQARRRQLAELRLLGVLDKDDINTYSVATALAGLVPDKS
jgi:CheY-like chemotaxis protein